MSRTKQEPTEKTEMSTSTKWRSLDDGSETKASFDVSASSLVSRRGFMQVAGASAAAVGVSGCIRRPVENILPFSEAPEYVVPGVPLHFATTISRGSDALGLLVTSHDGRPTKVEGNPNHPSSLGATDLRAQLLVADLYDADRSRAPARQGEDGLEDVEMGEFDEAFTALVAGHEADGGSGLRFLAPASSGPSEDRLRKAITARFPAAKFHTYESVNTSNAQKGAELAFGHPVSPVIDFSAAKTVLALDSDFLGSEDGSVRNARGFARNRGIESPQQEMSRLYAVEATHSVTGANADHRLRLPAADVDRYLRVLATKLAAEGVSLAGLEGRVGSASSEGIPAKWVDEVAAELLANRGASAVVVGPRQPAHVHALAHAVNVGLGNLGTTLTLFQASHVQENVASIKELADEIESVNTLVILGGNPVYDAPSDIGFAALLGREGLTSVHLAAGRDETSKLASWHCPLANELEAWGDHHAVDGTISVQQPLIAPLWHARSALELLAQAAGERNWRGHKVVQKTLRDENGAAGFQAAWRRTLHSGVVAGSGGHPLAEAALDPASLATAISAPAPVSNLSAENLEVNFIADPALHDGRHANNLAALEAPNPLTKLVWDNAVLMSKHTRDELGLSDGQVVKLAREGAGEIEGPAFALPGHADWSITLFLGWGRTDAGRYGSQPHPGYLNNGGGERPGFDVQPLRTTDGFYFADGVTLTATAASIPMAQTQLHDNMENRPIAIDATLEEYKAEPDFASYDAVEFKSVDPLWDTVDYSTGPQWGMSIDLSACTGCNACTVACHSENNVPSVGKREVERGRSMNWLRIDRYFTEIDDDTQVSLQPIACQQCEEAPCENVCPVNATTHSPEGLNDMAYNRCVGTRYCANNCPYKVRRFNYLDWHSVLDDRWKMHGAFPHERRMQFNPNVTVRMRGVMEKCSYCVQRIQATSIQARRERREIGRDEVVSACQQACPSGAIVFGNIADPESRISRLRSMDRSYLLLAELGIRPRTTFLGKIRNPNPAMGPAAGGEEAAEAHG